VDQARSLVDRIVVSLDSITGLEKIWRRGLVHRGGPHYRLLGTIGPVSIGEDECLILGKLITRFKPANCFVVGNGFGLSSVFIAKIMEVNGGVSVVTLDSKKEGDGERCFETAEQLRVSMDCRILRNKYGVSPRDIDKAGGSDRYDFVFIDGDHSHPQPTDDFHGVKHLLRKNGVLCWHDYWFAGVSESVAEAQRNRYQCVKINSSCEMVFGTRDEGVFREFGVLFDNAETPAPRSHPLARFMLTRSFVWGSITTKLLRRH
jgi:predicted O-methyltransferase YrrM